MKKIRINKFVLAYGLSFGLAVGLFQNCTRAEFASLPSTDAGNQGLTSFDPTVPDVVDTPSTPVATSPVIGTIEPTANPAVVTSGQTTTITVVTTNIDRVDYVCAVAADLTAAGVFRQGSLTPNDNTFTIAPTQTSGCRFTGFGAKLSTPVVRDLPIVVKAPETLVGKLSVKANPSTIAVGASTTITATMTNITSVSYKCAAGLDVSGAIFQQGTLTPAVTSFSMSPAQTSTCQFTGTGPNLAGPSITTVTVTVNQPEPVVGSLDVTANPAAITVGQSTFITAVMKNIDAVGYKCAQGADGSGVVFAQGVLSPNDPSFAFSPTQTSFCTFTGTGPNLKNPVIRTLTVVVNQPAPVVGGFTVSANPSVITSGQGTTVTASALQNVTQISYSCSTDANGAVFAQGTLTAANPSFSIAPTSSSTCQFTGTGPNLAAPVTKTLSIVVNPPQPICNANDVTLLSRSLMRSISTTETEVANACGDGAVSAADSLPKPGGDPAVYVRFFNTCGNRYCVNVRGATSGRVVEDNMGQVVLTCLFNQMPSNLTPTCQAAVGTMPAPFSYPSVSNEKLANDCVDPVVPAVADQYPNGTDVSRQIRWTYTCGNRECNKLGYNSGRIVENNSTTAYLECSSLENLNKYASVPVVQSITTTADAISAACVDGAFPTASSSLPNGNPLQLLRFMNTCGNRFCAQQGFSIGRVTEINQNLAIATCSR